MLMEFPRNFATAAFSAVVGSSAAQVCMQHTGLGVLPHPLDAADAEPTTPDTGWRGRGSGREGKTGRRRHRGEQTCKTDRQAEMTEIQRGWQTD